MATKKTKVSDVKKLENSMQNLVAGVVPTNARRGGGSISPNKINDTSSLALQVRGEFITLNYSLLSFLYQQFGLVQSLVEVPVLDAFRGGLKFNAYEKKVVPDGPKPKKRNNPFRFWLMNEDKKEQLAEKDFDVAQQERRDKWEQEQRAKDAELKKSSDEHFRKQIPREEARMIELYLQRNEVWQKFTVKTGNGLLKT